MAFGINLLTAYAATFPTAYDTNTDAVAQLFVRAQIGQQVGPLGSNFWSTLTFGTSNFMVNIVPFPGLSVTFSTNATGLITATLVNASIATNNYQLGFTNSGLYLGSNASQWSFRDDTVRLTNLPVALLVPTLTNTPMILDLMPTGDNSITNASSPFFTAIDLLNRNLDTVVDKTNFQVARLAIKTNEVIVGSSAGGTSDAPSVVFPAGTNSSRPFSWVLLGRGAASLNTNMWMDSLGILHESNGIAGTVVADSPIAGVVGEFTNRLNVFGTATNFITSISTNVLVMTLSAGDWDVSGNVNISGTTATVTGEVASIGTIANTVSGDGSQCFSFPAPVVTSYTDTIAIPLQRINVSTSTTVFMTAKITFSAGTVVGWGQIRARRIR